MHFVDVISYWSFHPISIIETRHCLTWFCRSIRGKVTSPPLINSWNFWENTMDSRYSNLSQLSENNFCSKIIFEQKFEKCIIHARSMPNSACYKHHLHWFAAHYLTKASFEISAPFVKEFLSKGIFFRKKHFWSSTDYKSCPHFKSFRLLHQHWHNVKNTKKAKKDD